MKMILACAVALALASGVREDANGAWGAFIREPNAGNYRQIVQIIDSCRAPPCEVSVRPDSATVARVVKLIGSDQHNGINAAFHSYRLLDGGDLEDVARALGGIADANPRMFLEAIKKHGLSTAQVSGIVTMMPSHVIDDLDARIAAIRARMESLSGVGDQGLSREKAAALGALEEALQEAREHQTRSMER